MLEMMSMYSTCSAIHDILMSQQNLDCQERNEFNTKFTTFQSCYPLPKISVTEFGFSTRKTRMSANTFENENKLPIYSSAERGRRSLTITCASNTDTLVDKTTSSWHSQASFPHPLSLAVRRCWTDSSASFFKTKEANSRQLCACADISVIHRLQLLLRKGEGLTKSCVQDPRGYLIYPKVSQC